MVPPLMGRGRLDGALTASVYSQRQGFNLVSMGEWELRWAPAGSRASA